LSLLYNEYILIKKFITMKVKEEKYKGKHGGSQVKARSQESISALQVLSKPTITCGKDKTGDTHPIISEWERAWQFLSQMSMGHYLPPITLKPGKRAGHVITWLP
jgi:hypothetical protein